MKGSEVATMSLIRLVSKGFGCDAPLADRLKPDTQVMAMPLDLFYGFWVGQLHRHARLTKRESP